MKQRIILLQCPYCGFIASWDVDHINAETGKQCRDDAPWFEREVLIGVDD